HRRPDKPTRLRVRFQSRARSGPPETGRLRECSTGRDLVLSLGGTRRRIVRSPRAHQIHSSPVPAARARDSRTPPLRGSRNRVVADRTRPGRIPAVGRGRVRTRLIFAAIGAIAALTGAAAWWATRVPREPSIPTPSISAGAIWTTSFKDTAGATHSLGEFQGQVVVINFWATWCAP